MKRNTIARGLSDRPVDGGDVAAAVRRLQKHAKAPPEPVKEGNLVTVLNEEVIPVVRELRTKANLELREAASAATAGSGAWTELWRSPALETNGVYALSADIVWSGAVPTVWAHAVVSNTIVSSSGVVSMPEADFGAGHYTGTGLADSPPRWIADPINRQAVLEFVDDGAVAMRATAIVTMFAREL